MIAVGTSCRYFPHCSEVVDKFLDYDWSNASFLEKGTPEEQILRRAYFMKLKEDMQEALCKDVAYHRHSGLPSSWSAFYKYLVAESNRSGMSIGIFGTWETKRI